MRLKVISSSSAGNCYLLQSSGGSTLILEAGVPVTDIKKAMGFTLQGVVSCLVTHRHNDHAKSVSELLKLGIPVCTSSDVLEANEEQDNVFSVQLRERERRELGGGFYVTPLKAFHDVHCLAYIVEHEEMGRLLFATDTYKLPYKVKGLNHLMVECNYQDDVLAWNMEHGNCIASLRERLMLTHMELQTTQKVVKKNLSANLQDVVLLHLSADNSNAEQMRKDISAACGIPVYVAETGLEIAMDLDPY